MTARLAPRPLTDTVADYLRILRADPNVSNDDLFAKAGRKSTEAAAEARRQIRAEWASRRAGPVPQQPAPQPAAPSGDVDAAMDLLAAALAAKGMRLVGVTVEQTTTTVLTPRVSS